MNNNCEQMPNLPINYLSCVYCHGNYGFWIPLFSSKSFVKMKPLNFIIIQCLTLLSISERTLFVTFRVNFQSHGNELDIFIHYEYELRVCIIFRLKNFVFIQIWTLARTTCHRMIAPNIFIARSSCNANLNPFEMC